MFAAVRGRISPIRAAIMLVILAVTTSLMVMASQEKAEAAGQAWSKTSSCSGFVQWKGTVNVSTTVYGTDYGSYSYIRQITVRVSSSSTGTRRAAAQIGGLAWYGGRSSNGAVYLYPRANAQQGQTISVGGGLVRSNPLLPGDSPSCVMRLTSL